MLEDKKKLRILFMGTPDFSAKILTALLDADYDIIGVFTQSDKKVGRKQVIEKSPVKIIAEKNNLLVFTPHRFGSEIINDINGLQPDLIILVAYGKILPKEVLTAPRLGAVNIHPSLLPKFRGPSPIQNTLLSGDEMTGSTIMMMDASVDTGDILRQKEIAVTSNETYVELADKLADFSANLLLETLDDFLAGDIVPQKQDDALASYCKMIKKADGQINWQNSAETIYNKYRAFFAWPGIFTSLDIGGQSKRLKLNEICVANINPNTCQPGEVFQSDDNIYVQTSDGAIRLKEVQLEGKPSMNVLDFANGHKNFIGSILA